MTLEELDKRIAALETEKPYECPVCEGLTKFKVFGTDDYAECPACRGKGIVWRE